MGVPNEDVVQIEGGNNSGEPCVITVNCPDKTGLGCDLCRIILEFGLSITRGDISYELRRVLLHLRTPVTSNKSSLLKSPFEFFTSSSAVSITLVAIFNYSCFNRWKMVLCCVLGDSAIQFNNSEMGKFEEPLTVDVTHVLCELELIIQRVKVSTTPDGRVMDLFFITDSLDLLHTKKRRDETLEQLNAVLGESCLSCELLLAGPEYEGFQHSLSSLPSVITEELFSFELSENEFHSQALTPELTKVKKAIVTIDNSLSPAHTLLQIHCVDQKGLLYDIMRTLKDCNIQISYGRFSPIMKGYCEMDLFIQQLDGEKKVDSEKQNYLSSRLRMEMLHPLRVIIANRGPDIELLVANPVELSGKGRPRVFYDVTLALKVLGICIFSAEIGRHSTSDRQWEVYRFLLDDTHEFPLSNPRARNQIVDRVRRTLMGW